MNVTVSVDSVVDLNQKSDFFCFSLNKTCSLSTLLSSFTPAILDLLWLLIGCWDSLTVWH